VSFLHPSYYRLLPPTARPQLIAFLQLVERNTYRSADGWTDLRQAALARELGRSVREVRRYERACVELGVLVIERHRRGNRRRLALKTAKEASSRNGQAPNRTLREWGHACPYSGDTRVRTPAPNAPVTARARSPSRRPSSTLQPAAPAERASHGGRVSQELVRACEPVVRLLGLRWQRKLLELVLELARTQGDRQTAGFLRIVQERVEGVVDPYKRARAAFALLGARIRKASSSERRGTNNPLAARAGDWRL
jgi:hypothetical protein